MLNKKYALAEYFMMLDNIRDGINPKCPQILRKANAKEIFGDKDWKVFGSPVNACNLWNDLRIQLFRERLSEKSAREKSARDNLSRALFSDSLSRNSCKHALGVVPQKNRS